jgi:hypothetical protein
MSHHVWTSRNMSSVMHKHTGLSINFLDFISITRIYHKQEKKKKQNINAAFHTKVCLAQETISLKKLCLLCLTHKKILVHMNINMLLFCVV